MQEVDRLHSQSGTQMVDTTGREADLIEGDIMVTFQDAVEFYGLAVAEDLEASGFKFLPTINGDDMVGRNLGTVDRRWPDRHPDGGRVIVFYEFENGSIPVADIVRRNAIRGAMDYLEESGVVEFRLRTAALETPFIEIHNLNPAVCHTSGIGYDPAVAAPHRTLNMGWCNSAAEEIDLVHELLHILVRLCDLLVTVL